MVLHDNCSERTLCAESFSTRFDTERHIFVRNILILIPWGVVNFSF